MEKRKLNRKRPVTTLFLLQSVDGKISTGDTDKWDVDKDIPKLTGNPASGLHQYYEAEQETDLWCINSGRVMAKVGVNSWPIPKESSPVTFVVIDNEHLNAHGVEVMAKRGAKLVLITSNKSHPAYKSDLDNIEIIEYTGKLDPNKVLERLGELGCDEVTIQTGGTLNGMWLRAKCIDKVNIVICPMLVGGKTVSTLIDGDAAKSLSDIGILELTKVKKLNNSYLELFYDVVK